MAFEDDKKFYWRIARRTVRACWMVLWHLIGAIMILACLKVLEIVLGWMWRDHDPTYFGAIPLSFIIDSVDITVFIIFIVFGLYDVYRELRTPAATTASVSSW